MLEGVRGFEKQGSVKKQSFSFGSMHQHISSANAFESLRKLILALAYCKPDDGFAVCYHFYASY